MNQVTTTAQPTMRDLSAMPLDQAIQANTQQFSNALPAHIPVERFKRVVMTAISSNPDLAKADRRSLFNSAVKAAQDGLLPDGRDGALIVYKTSVKNKEGNWDKVAMVQWQRMIAGVRKLIRNSGQISDLWAEVVYEKDEFDYQLGLNRNLVHKPAFKMPLKDRGPIVAAYSVAKLKDGSTSFDVMSADEIWDVWRKASKQKDKDSNPTGMWKDYPSEAFKKTVVKRHSKQLPMATDLDDIVRDDEELYDMKGASDGAVKNITPSRPQMSDFSLPAGEEQIAITEDGEIIEDEQSQPQKDQPAPQPVDAEGKPADTPASKDESAGTADAEAPDQPDEIWNNGFFAFGEGKPLMSPPQEYTDAEKVKWKDGWRDAEMKSKSKLKV
jgi:recombination protein RecT